MFQQRKHLNNILESKTNAWLSKALAKSKALTKDCNMHFHNWLFTYHSSDYFKTILTCKLRNGSHFFLSFFVLKKPNKTKQEQQRKKPKTPQGIKNPIRDMDFIDF